MLEGMWTSQSLSNGLRKWQARFYFSICSFAEIKTLRELWEIARHSWHFLLWNKSARHKRIVSELTSGKIEWVTHNEKSYRWVGWMELICVLPFIFPAENDNYEDAFWLWKTVKKGWQKTTYCHSTFWRFDQWNLRSAMRGFNTPKIDDFDMTKDGAELRRSLVSNWCCAGGLSWLCKTRMQGCES